MKSYIYLNDCLGNDKIDRYYYASPPPYSPNTVNQTVDYGGVRWKGNPGSGWSQVGFTGSPGLDTGASTSNTSVPTMQDVINSANSLNTQLQTAVQPSIQTLQARTPDINAAYQNLVDSIKGQTNVAEQAQTRATTTNLGARGVDTNSGLGQTELAQGLQPYEASKQSALAQAQLGNTQDITSLANAIATLQNTYPGALSTAGGLAGAQYGLAGQQAQANAAIQAAQLQLQGYQAEANKPFAVGGNVYNPSTGGFTSGPLANLATIGGSPGGASGGVTNKPASNLPATVGGAYPIAGGYQQPKLNIAAPPSGPSASGAPNLLSAITGAWNAFTNPQTVSNQFGGIQSASNPNSYLKLGGF